ncbi:UDP-N-acetylglucosamine 1-carboxyvinyltransferase, partial [Candidatus Uhrbacteria bacterium]|nr:UDP-N-acetylglucosamine 1-carboxyvinyltransferase [Candidatus Uhrbacteria bacterium]
MLDRLMSTGYTQKQSSAKLTLFFVSMKMVIQGGRHLRGRVPIMGAKNSIAPLIAASIIVKGVMRIKNVPRITDALLLLEILQSMGAKVEWVGPHELTIDTKDLDPKQLDKKKMKRIRFSVLFLGPMLARFKKIFVPEPGGCNIGNRPIDTHLYALGRLGAKVERDEDGSLYLESGGLKGGYVILKDFTVTGTENVIMAAVLAKGKTSIRLAAAEPHVQALCQFLNAAGAKIKGIGTHDLEITGVTQLRAPKTWTLIPDTIEIGTFAVAAALTHGDVEMSPVIPEHLDAIQNALERAGVNFTLGKKSLRVQSSGRLDAFTLDTRVYPGFPTDLQAPFGLLATQCHGTSLIHDPIYESRMGYIHELIKMGA